MVVDDEETFAVEQARSESATSQSEVYVIWIRKIWRTRQIPYQIGFSEYRKQQQIKAALRKIDR